MGWGVPSWVERDFRSYLRCGILAHGFARVRCTDCGHDRLLAFSCKGRGVCPSCNARRMAEALDGVVSGDIPRGVRFHEATGLGARDAEALGRIVQRRVLRWFARRELMDRTTAADMRTWRGTGGFSVDGSVRIEGADRAGLERLVRYCARGPLALERLHAPAGIGALSSPEARLVYRLPEPDVHGRQALRLTPLELLERLARLVPPPDQRFASVPSIAIATTGSSLPTHA